MFRSAPHNMKQLSALLSYGTRTVIGLSTEQAVTFLMHFWAMSILSQQYVPDSSDSVPGLRGE